MPNKVFISYRRADSRYQARMIYATFCQIMPRENVFMDVDSIPPGANFRKMLNDWVNECDVLLALIGPGWIDATDPKTGRRRLENPNDFVRIEIGEALARHIPVVPVLIDDTPMPDVELLPKDLKELVDRQAEFVEYRTFDVDVERLIKKLGLTQRPVQSGIRVDANFIHGAPAGLFEPGAGKTQWFKDHKHGPELVVVPAYEFLMGSNESDSEKPIHKVAIPSPFAVGRFPVTFAEWDACIADGSCGGYRPDDQEWGRDRRPVINANWDDAKLYIRWLNAKTGKPYRLLSEAEREYVTRAGTTTAFWWGDELTPKLANYDGSGANGEYRRQTVPVDSFEANPWGLFNVHGNVWEWCEDTWHDNYNGAPTDGSAWMQNGDYSRRVVRGGSWYVNPQDLRATVRDGYARGNRVNFVGFRLARTLEGLY
jgi:formylglycine-generating enzyme required for sulfatase activity